MTVEEFLDEYNYAPWDDIELAEMASKVEGEIGRFAKEFLQAHRVFERALNDIGYDRRLWLKIKKLEII